MRQSETSISKDLNSLEEKALLGLLLELDLVSAIRSEIITNGLCLGIRWFNQRERSLEASA